MCVLELTAADTLLFHDHSRGATSLPSLWENETVHLDNEHPSICPGPQAKQNNKTEIKIHSV